MTAHIFTIGDRVCLSVAMRNTKDSAAVFVVKNRLPHVGAELQYRIRSETEPHDRVVTEGQLSSIEDTMGDPILAAVIPALG